MRTDPLNEPITADLQIYIHYAVLSRCMFQQLGGHSKSASSCVCSKCAVQAESPSRLLITSIVSYKLSVQGRRSISYSFGCPRGILCVRRFGAAPLSRFCHRHIDRQNYLCQRPNNRSVATSKSRTKLGRSSFARQASQAKVDNSCVNLAIDFMHGMEHCNA